ncbi:16S rRNA (cytosine(967)-C(5))-methyltransferase RsmB [Roseateles sp.]|uniref:16S rRNA (cytosine(967)-C(5))-methyltransferase RsmB n=1 Tax=Roseateles sp. TaxID=1971397 RepID=UPI003D0CAC06
MPKPAPSNPAGPALAPPLQQLLMQVADAVQAVRGGRSLTDLLAKCPAELRPATQSLSFHVLRRLGSAEAVRAILAPKSPPPKVEGLLLSALALLWDAGPDQPPAPYADHTVVDQAVSAVRKRLPASAGFVNAVLRRFLRERPALQAQAAQGANGPVAAYNHPLWWSERLRADWPEVWPALLLANNQHPPMTLRVNARQGSAADYLQRLQEAGIAAHALGPLAPQALLLERAVPVTALPGFAQGAVSVQDAAAQIASPLLVQAQGVLPALQAGARVLDACSAPGGKTAHLLELGDFDVLALDSDAKRLTRVQDNLARLGQRAELKAADARTTASWWDGRMFDAILLDAPCSASGIVRRHPDVRWLRRPGDIAQLASIQAELLAALWPTLKPGGRMVYATCSMFKAEGEAQIDAFLQRQADASRLEVSGFTGHLLPLAHNEAPEDMAVSTQPRASAEAVFDGFFYALLHKRA